MTNRHTEYEIIIKTLEARGVSYTECPQGRIMWEGHKVHWDEQDPQFEGWVMDDYPVDLEEILTAAR